MIASLESQIIEYEEELRIKDEELESVRVETL